MLRVIREVLFYEPRRRGTDLNEALEFLMRVTPHRAITVVISDFIGLPGQSPRGKSKRRLPPAIDAFGIAGSGVVHHASPGQSPA